MLLARSAMLLDAGCGYSYFQTLQPFRSIGAYQTPTSALILRAFFLPAPLSLTLGSERFGFAVVSYIDEGDIGNKQRFFLVRQFFSQHFDCIGN